MLQQSNGSVEGDAAGDAVIELAARTSLEQRNPGVHDVDHGVEAEDGAHLTRAAHVTAGISDARCSMARSTQSPTGAGV
jgi:hypothetical protein